MKDIGIWIVAVTLSTMVVDRRYRSGYRDNAQLRGWRRYLICFGAGIFFLGWLFESDESRLSHAKPTESRNSESTQSSGQREPAPTAPRKAALAGIELGSHLQSLLRQGADCYEDEEFAEFGSVSCELQAHFGGLSGRINARLKDDRVTVVFANDNASEQLAALRSELLSTYGLPTPIEDGERWTVEGEMLELTSVSVVLYRPE